MSVFLACFIVAISIRDCHPARELLQKGASFEVQKVTHANVHSLSPRQFPPPNPLLPCPDTPLRAALGPFEYFISY